MYVCVCKEFKRKYNGVVKSINGWIWMAGNSRIAYGNKCFIHI